MIWVVGGAATGFLDLRGKKVEMSILDSLSSGTCLRPLRLLSLHILELSSNPKDDRSPNPEILLVAAIKLFILGRLVDRSCFVAFWMDAICFLKETLIALVFKDPAPEPITNEVFSFLAW